MKNWKISIGTALAVMSMAGMVWAQGPLMPPGEPGKTMRTLDQLDTAIAGVSNAVSQVSNTASQVKSAVAQVSNAVSQVSNAVAQVSNRVAEVKTVVGLVEPRTPIANVPYTISQSGSYYLSTNLTSTSNGVVITASGVTLDLMGFMLSGDRGSSDCGIFLDGATNSAIRNVTVRNGIVRNFGCGIRAEYAQDSRFEHLIAATNSISGIYLYCPYGQCVGNTIADCTISGNGDYGVHLYGFSGYCDGNTIADCTIRTNGYGGIYLYSAEGNRVEGNHITGQTGSPSYGIYCDYTVGNLFFRNTCVGQTNNFTITASDTYGPIVTTSGPLANTGDASHPLANFSR